MDPWEAPPFWLPPKKKQEFCDKHAAYKRSKEGAAPTETSEAVGKRLFAEMEKHEQKKVTHKILGTYRPSPQQKRTLYHQLYEQTLHTVEGRLPPPGEKPKGD